MTKKEIIDYCLTRADSYEDYPFGVDWTVIRHKSNKKSFALIYEHCNNLCINLKCEPQRSEFLRSIKHGITPGYHVNKTHWNTITLPSDVSYAELCDMIDISYSLTKKHIKAKAKL